MNNKTGWGIVVAAVVLVIVGAVIYMQWGDKEAVSVVEDGTGMEQEVVATTTEEGAGTETGGTAAGKLSYTDAVKKYGMNRIQFQGDCDTEQNQLTFKGGTAVMFDNRSTSTRTINLGGTRYTLGAQDYRVITLTAASYPSTLLVDCGAKQNVATILLQR